MIPGKIVIGIDKKVYFEYYKLEKPNQSDYSGKYMPYFDEYGYYEAMDKYRASKQLIEVSNIFWWNESKVWTFTSRYYSKLDGKNMIDNQRCKAEVIGDTCTIIELL